MSYEAVSEVIAHAMLDEEYRKQLFTDPEAALADYALTDEERESLKALDSDVFNQLAVELEERISKASAGLTFPLRPSKPVPFRMLPRDINRLLGG